MDLIKLEVSYFYKFLYSFIIIIIIIIIISLMECLNFGGQTLFLEEK
jgi:hypothetical protein